MKISNGKWPSSGCLVVCICYALVAVFFAWGFSTPELDRVWTVHQQLKIGKLGKLSDHDRKLLDKCMARYPRLASDLLDGKQIGIISANNDGWIATPAVTVVRTERSGGTRSLQLEIQTPPDLLPYRIAVRGMGWKRTLQVKRQGQLAIALPRPPPTPEVVEISLHGQAFEPDPSVLGVRLRFGKKP